MAADDGRTPVLGRLTSGQWLAVGSGGLALIALGAIVLSLLALERQTDRRDLLVDGLDPAARSAQRLLTGLVDEETGVRGFALTGRSQFLEPFENGQAESAEAAADLRRRLDTVDREQLVARLATAEEAVAAWRDGYALPAIAAVERGDLGVARDGADEGKAAFDATREAIGVLQRDLRAARIVAERELDEATRVTQASLVVVGLLLLISTLVLWLILRRAVGQPLAHLASTSRRISSGEYALELEPDGSRDVRDVTADIERMRGQIVRELAALEEAREQLEAQAADLQRSNEELEQFAYVASHDLQEPLRKVASFCQMLERRYSGQLDERADQYIAFAVDGAKRMQILINDLLAFSRVGRVGSQEFEEFELREALDDALANLEGPLDEADGRVEIRGDLPRVRGDEALLAGVFQNLIGNAIKFRGDAPPHVTVTTTPDPSANGDGGWQVTIADNGIGIDDEYADRIFVIFQRLHAKDAYPGTGIGLAMTRKIIEYHGGRIWLEPSEGPGSTFAFTLPAPEEPSTA
ncbi:MAG: CHASE3 domain-containing protein [Solirubrobacteraceae bacterium]|nr:CHASE3 domain-containing protein [Solirubrobacteraceae bacterium]